MAGKGGSGGGGLPNYNNANSSYLPTSMSAGMGGMAPMGLGILGQGPSQFPRSAPLPSSALHDLGFSLALLLSATEFSVADYEFSVADYESSPCGIVCRRCRR